MNKNELIKKLEDIEWEDFEVKEAKSEIPKSSWETVSAFSNTSGGWIVFGVSKKGKDYKIKGVENPERIEQNFTTVLRGQKFNQKAIEKISVLRKKIDSDSLECELEVDGGINAVTGKKVVEAGANVLVAGTAVFKHSKGVKFAINELQNL